MSYEDRKLHVRIYDATKELCRVVMPLASVANLEHLFPDVDLQKVKSAGVNIAAVIERAHANGLVAQDLLQVTAEQRSYHIWIA